MISTLLRHCRRPFGPSLFLLGPLLISLIIVVHGERIQQHWSTYHWEDQLFFDHDHRFIHRLDHCFTRPALWPGLYRPLTTNCYYLIGGWLFDHRIEIYHAINVTLYTLNALLFYWLARYLLAPGYALLAAALWVTRNAHAELITNSAEFQALAATSFALAALAIFAQAVGQQRQWAMALVYCFIVLALLSKEASVAIAVILPCHRWLFAHSLRWPHLVGPLAIAGGWLVTFLLFLRGVSDYQPTGFHYAIDPALVLHNMAAHFWSFFNLLVPRNGDVVMPQAVHALAASPGGQMVLLGLLGLTILLCVRQPRLSHELRVLLLGNLFFLLGVLPYSFFTDRLFMRYGYFSHLGLALASAAFIAWGAKQLKTLRDGRKSVHNAVNPTA